MKAIKWIGIVLLSLFIIIAIFAFIQIKQAENRLTKAYDIDPIPLVVSDDSVSLSIGKKWVKSQCAECHGDDLGGKPFINDPAIGTLYAPNLTKGEGGLSYYSDKDWLLALRHGVSSTGRALMIMPSLEYTQMYKEDITGIIAYIKTVKPVNRMNGTTEFKPFAKFLLAMGAFGDVFGVEKIDHKATVPERPESETVLDRGAYLSIVGGCTYCHGKELSGKATGDPASPPASNLTPGGNLGNWDYNDFVSFAQTGKTKEGKEINPKFMPWKAMGRLPANELEALFNYLKSLETKASAI